MRAARAAFVLWGLILMEPVHADAPDARPEIRELVEKIRAGRTFYGNDVDVLLAPNGRLEPATVALLAKGLAEAGSDPRQELALALVLSAQRADPLRNQGREAILDQGVVDALAGPGISKTDPAKETCLWALVQSAPPRLVALRGAELLASLKAHPDPTTALAVAKAKPAGALETIDRIMKETKVYRESVEFQAARAAVGDSEAEGKYIREFRETSSPKTKTALARRLGLIGTPAALKALGEALRSPLIEVGDLRRRSVRVDVLDALRLSFPERTELIWQAYKDDRGYDAAEKFVAETLKVTWPEPRPPFFTQYVAPQPSAPPMSPPPR
jgi:hypothetical protein